MMELKQNDREHLQDMVQREEMTADQANVEKVRLRRVQLVIGRIPAHVRKALNDAVKRGYLGHATKDGRKPEAYYHPTFEHLAKQERRDHERKVMAALGGVMARPFEFED
jgi:hypothetical protein